MRRIYYWNMENSMYGNYRARKEVDEAVIHFHPGIALRGRGFDLYEHIIFLGGRSAQFTRMNLRFLYLQFRNPRLTVQAVNWMKNINRKTINGLPPGARSMTGIPVSKDQIMASAHVLRMLTSSRRCRSCTRIWSPLGHGATRIFHSGEKVSLDGDDHSRRKKRCLI